MNKRVCGGLAAVMALGLAGAGCRSFTPSAADMRQWSAAEGNYQLASGPLRLEFQPEIDRVVSFRHANGPEMLFTQKLDQGPLADEAYTFFGGAYTWVSPQGGERGWLGPEGADRVWPPDPAMDVGPAQVESFSDDRLTAVTPVSRQGLVEQKVFALEPDRARVTFTLVNEGENARTAGAWINTACFADSVIAVRLRSGARDDVWGWDQTSIDRFLSVTSPAGRGWSLVLPGEAAWEGGIKVYLPTPSEGDRAEIAIWREGWWLHRTQMLTEQEFGVQGRLKELGEGPVAIYIQPGTETEPWLIEAELYGPIVDIEPGGAHTATETWRLVRSDTPDPSVLD
jgi:hypothetical protein